MTKLTLTDVTTGYASVETLNENFDDIEVALDNTLSRDGTYPNFMSADLDMNGHNILNANIAGLSDIDVSAIYWAGDWSESTAYNVNTAVLYQGSSYICTGSHTSSSDFLADYEYWQLLAANGLYSLQYSSETKTATSSQTVFNLSSITYTPGAGNLSVYVQGTRKFVGTDYTETDQDTVTFLSGITAGYKVVFITAGEDQIGLQYLPLIGGTMTGALALASGSAAAPSLTFNGYTDTGFYRDGVDSVGVSINGVRMAYFYENGGARSFRVSSVGTNNNDGVVVLYPNYISLSPTGDSSSVFYGYGYTPVATNQYTVFRGYKAMGTSTTPIAINASAAIVALQGYGYDGSAWTNQGQISINADAAWTGSSKPTRIQFYTTAASSTTSTVRMYIQPDGSIECEWNPLKKIKVTGYIEAASTSTSIDYRTASHYTYDMTSSKTLSFAANPSTAGAVGITVITIGQGSAYSITWPSGISWADGSAPTVTTTDGRADVYSLLWDPAESKWYGFVIKQNITQV